MPARPALLLALAVASSAVAGCTKGASGVSGSAIADGAASSREEPTASASAPEASTSTPSEAATTASAAVAANTPLVPREPVRRSIRRLEDERLLAPHAAMIAKHFEGVVPSPLTFESATVAGDRRELLVYAETPPARPLLFLTSAQGDLLWTKERPLAGTRQIVTEMVVAPGPNGEVALLWCDIPTQIVGLRKWAADGIVLADFQVLEVDLCEALAALYWPGHGWVAVASQHGAARAQLLDERGLRSWGPSGIALPWDARPSSPAAIAVDSDASAIVLQVGDRPHAGSVLPDRVLAMRFDTRGAPLWDAPIDVGPAPRGGPSAHIAATVAADGVKVTVGGARPDARATVTLTSAGALNEGR